MTTPPAQPMAPVVPSTGALSPLGLDQVRITGGFWGQRQALNAAATIPHALAWERKVGWIANFERALTEDPERTGLWFSDSDVYKLLEAMAWEVARSGDAGLEAQIEALAELIAPVQMPDGYLNTHYEGTGRDARYSDFRWGHELYSYGHLFQAAVARLRAGRHDALVDIALRAADHVCDTFGADGLVAVCGHPEVETALVELGRATGQRRYIEQAKLFIDRRGRGLLGDCHFGRAYYQDDIPVRDTPAFRGHAVRAGYLAAGALDVAVETGDDELFQAVKAQYERTLARRTYLTGGLGSRQVGEAMGDDWELPSDLAYCETCAAISSVMVAWRLLLATGQERYADVIERTLYNAVAVSPSSEGTAFFYANPLHQRHPGQPGQPDVMSGRADTTTRAPWFNVSCCPTNVARVYASAAALVASVAGDEVRIHQFAPAELTVQLGDGRAVSLVMRTDYPYDGVVEVEVVQAPAGEWALSLRLPGWAVEADLEGLTEDEDRAVRRGVIPAGTVVRLGLDIEPRFTYPDPRIDAVRGCVAVERGPLVLCLESVDLPAEVELDQVSVVDEIDPVAARDGARVTGHVWEWDEAEPYGPDGWMNGVGRTVPLTLVPYHRWGNRGPSAMRVWLPED